MKRQIIILLVGSIIAAVPYFVGAAGLVPCGGTGEPACESCHVVSLASNVIGWLVLILGTVAAIVIIYAGIKLVTSGGNQRAMEDAKSMITNIIIGYVIVLAGWLIIDYVMKVLVNESTFGVWNEIECTTQAVPEDKGQVILSFELETAARTVSNTCPLLPNGAYNCAALQAACTSKGAVPVIDPSTPSIVRCQYPMSAGRPAEAYESGDCSGARFVQAGVPASISQTFSCISRVESGCNLNADNPASSARGVMQVLRGYAGCHDHNQSVCLAAARAAGYTVGSQLNCSTAFGSGGRVTPGKEQLAAACDAASSNFNCNVQVAMCLYNNGGFGHWTNGPGHTGQQKCVAQFGR